MRAKDGCFLLFLGLFYLIGTAALGYWVWSVWHGLQAEAWPTTTAQITRLSVEETTLDGSPNYRLQVQYTYAVEGVPYEGSRLSFGYGGSGKRGKEEAVREKLREATTVAVRYDPSDPATSCLYPGVDGTLWVLLAFAVGLLAFTILFHLLWWFDLLMDDE